MIKKIFGQVTAESIPRMFDYRAIFESDSFWASESSIDTIHAFTLSLQLEIILWNCIWLDGEEIYQNALKIIESPLSFPKIVKALPKKISHHIIKGHQAHQKLGFIAAAWLLDHNYQIQSEQYFFGRFVDICSSDYSWLIECGTTKSKKVFEYLEKADRYVGILPFNLEDFKGKDPHES